MRPFPETNIKINNKPLQYTTKLGILNILVEAIVVQTQESNRKQGYRCSAKIYYKTRKF